MKVEMAGPEAVTAVWRHRDLVGQQPVLVLEHLERPRLFRFAGGGVMTACDENHQSVIWADPHLVPVDAGVDRLWLTHFVTGGRVWIDAVDPDRARIAEGDQQVIGGNVGRHVDRSGRQRYRLAVWRQRARAGSMRNAVT